MTIARFGLTAAVLALMPVTADAADFSGAGAAFLSPIYARWAEAYRKESGVSLDYQPIGAADAIKAVKAKRVTFSASDAPLLSKELEEAGLVQFPMIMGGVLLVANVADVKSGELLLDGLTVARIFLGQINSWNDPSIARLNPGLRLPKQKIVVVHRSDSAGATYNFADYLSRVSREWTSRVGSSMAVRWPAGLGAKGNEGVAGTVSRTKGSIGYVEYAYAKQNDLPYVRMVNKAGKAVEPSPETFGAAAVNADWKSQRGYDAMLSNQSGARSWPMTAATWIMVYKRPRNTAETEKALKFFSWCYAKGDRMAEELDYVPMPDNVVSDVQDLWSTAIKDAAGKPLFRR